VTVFCQLICREKAAGAADLVVNGGQFEKIGGNLQKMMARPISNAIKPF